MILQYKQIGLNFRIILVHYLHFLIKNEIDMIFLRLSYFLEF
jgi:hypothetical protein